MRKLLAGIWAIGWFLVFMWGIHHELIWLWALAMFCFLGIGSFLIPAAIRADEAKKAKPPVRKRRYWQCHCCGGLLVTNPQDDASKYQCPQCQISRCSEGGYDEVTRECFMEEAGLQ